jgi:hypothetical protein
MSEGRLTPETVPTPYDAKLVFRRPSTRLNWPITHETARP